MLYVPGLTKDFISVSTLEDKGFQVKFRDQRVYIKPKGSDRSLDWVIGIRSGKVYRLHFESAKALVSSNNSQGDLWHRRMAHLHHGALRHLRQTVFGVLRYMRKTITTVRVVRWGRTSRSLSNRVSTSLGGP